MAIIKCTAKLLNELGAKPTTAQDQPRGLSDWHANLLGLERKKYVLFTNDQTLYSFLVRWVRTPRLADFFERFRLGLFTSLMSERFEDAQIGYVLSGHLQVIISKTNSRSVLGSMNELAFQIESMIRVSRLADTDLLQVNQQLNRIPMSAIKYNFSIREMKQRLADAHK